MPNQTESKSVRVRIAPSPTGNCHVGTARTALYNLLFARQRNGTFVLRIDDTDVKRSTQESEQGVFEGLRWLGLHWDEGPDISGAFGPYRQSERAESYQANAQALLDKGRAYYCFCTPDELERERRAALAAGQLPRYSGRCRNLSASQVKTKLRSGAKPVVRFKIDPRPTFYMDLIRGHLEQDAALLGDPIILRASGMPTYNFATIINEQEMHISHILRSAEHINNTFPQLQMYEALGFKPPEFGHFSLLLNPDRSKISKRTGAVFIGQFRGQGYLPEAMINHLALSGWNPGTEEEIFCFKDLLEIFSLDRCAKANAIFDRTKLLWLNGHYIRNITVQDLTQRIVPFLADAGLLDTEEPTSEKLEHLTGIVALEQERLKTLAEAPEVLEFFFRDPDSAHCIELLKSNPFARKHSLAELREALAVSLRALRSVTEWTASALKDTLNDQGAQKGWKRGEFLMPIRIAVSGREATPSLFETLQYVTQPATLRRLEAVINRLPQ